MKDAILALASGDHSHYSEKFKVNAWSSDIFQFFVAFLSHRPDRTSASLCLREIERGTDMRILIACAIIISAAVGLGGCFWHHQQAVATQPLK
jgi:hypothetical protein